MLERSAGLARAGISGDAEAPRCTGRESREILGNGLAREREPAGMTELPGYQVAYPVIPLQLVANAHQHVSHENNMSNGFIIPRITEPLLNLLLHSVIHDSGRAENQEGHP